jgi:hypothetical protein
MAVSNVLGKAYIEVHADTSPFARELEKEVAVIAESPPVKKSSSNAGETISKNLVEGATKRIEKETPGFFKKIAQNFSKENNKDRNTFSRIGQAVGQSLVDGIAKGASGLSGVITSLGSSVGNVGSEGPFAGIVGSLVAVGIPALIGLVVALAQTLGPLINGIGLLPGLFAAVAASIGPVIVGFQGFGDAITAILSRDPEKINEALKNLQPSARKVALEFQKMLPFFDKLKAVTQQSLFAGFTGDLTKLQKALGPTFLAGFKTVSTNAGKFIGSLLELFSSPLAQKFFKDMFKTADEIYVAFTPGLLKLVQGILYLADASQPYVAQLFKGLGATLGQFGDFLTTSVQNGDFQHFLDKFINALDLLIQLSSSTWNLITSILGGEDTQQSANMLFQQIIDTIDSLTEFFNSDRGQQSLKGMIVLAEGFVTALEAVALTLLYILSIIGDMYDMLHWILENTVGLPPVGILSRKAHTNTTNALGHHQDFADGGIAMVPTYGWTGENGPEAVIPLNDPRRAQQIMNQAGLNGIGQGDTHVTVYIGEEQVMARVDKRVGAAFKQFGRNTKYGPRFVGVGA